MRTIYDKLSALPSWIWVILIFLGVCVLAVTGLPGKSTWPQYLTTGKPVQDAYGILQLFVLEGQLLSDRGDGAAWQLWAAAFVAPGVTVFAFLQLIWSDVVAGTGALLNRYVRRGHIVVCGVGAWGRTHIHNCIDVGKRVIAIDEQPGCRALIPKETRRYRFIEGDAADPEILRQAGAARASAVVIFCGGDLNNLRLADAIGRALPAGKRQAPKIICCNSTPELTQQSYTDQRYNHDSDHPFRHFDPYEAAARHLLRSYPPDVYANLSARPRIHLAIYGYGQLGRAVLLEAIGLCQMAGYPTPQFTVIDPMAVVAEREFRARCPEFEMVCSVQFVADDINDDGFLAKRLPVIAVSVSQHVVCLAEASAVEPFGLRLQNALSAERSLNAPIVLGMMTGFEPASLADQHHARSDPTMLRPFRTRMLTAFGDSISVLSWENVVAEKHDRLARKNHENYLTDQQRRHKLHRFLKPAEVPWERLAEQYRRSNRAFVDHLPFKMRAIGRANVAGSGPAEFDESTLHRMAESEHIRWCAERVAAGWRYGEARSDPALVHPNLVPWNELDDGTKAYDVNLVANLDNVLKGSGTTIKRTCRLGVTGHRSPEISKDNKELRDRIKDQLNTIKRDYPDHEYIIVSSLAEGADRLVAELAMDQLNAKLHVPLPLPLELYLEDFVQKERETGQSDSATSLDRCQNLLAAADVAAEIPQKFGGFDELANTDPNLAKPSPRQHQYAYCGAYLVQHCHELICIWDGEPSRGTGGTAEVVGWRKAGTVPEIYRWTGLQVGPAVTMTAPVIVDFQRK